VGLLLADNRQINANSSGVHKRQARPMHQGSVLGGGAAAAINQSDKSAAMLVK
jgi:hypothetical protein